MRTISAGLLTLAFIAACGGGGGATGQPTTPAGQPTTPAAGEPTTPPAGEPTTPAAGGTGSVVHVVVASGPLAGTYDRTGIKYDCNISDSGSGATFLDMETTEGLSTLQFSAIEGGATVTKFYLNIVFGPPMTSVDGVEIQTLVPGSERGSGTATLQDNGATIKWTIDGTTEDDIGVHATVECGPVDRS